MQGDEALDTAVAFLKALSDHAVADERQHVKKVRELAGAWSRHLAIGGAHPNAVQSAERDYAGARRFVSQTLRDGNAAHLKTEQQFRDVAWGFASELHALVEAEAGDDLSLRANMAMLRGAAEGGNLDELRTITAKVSRELFSVIAARQDRRARAAAQAARGLPELIDVMQQDRELSFDPVTGLLDKKGLLAAAERVHVLSALADAPVSLVLIGLREFPLQGDGADVVMANLAPTVSRAFLSRSDILGREGQASFAVIAAGSDTTAARNAGTRARALLQTALQGNAATLGLRDVDLTLGVVPLAQPVTRSFQEARQQIGPT